MNALSTRSVELRAGSRTLCRDLTFGLKAGELVALLGRNGSGKTTLLKALAGLRPPERGEVFLQEQDIRALAPPRRARLLALMLSARQGDDFLRGGEFVALGRWPHTRWHGGLSQADRLRVREVLEATDTMALEQAHLGRLSDGEKQKLALARVLAQDTPLLLLDEPLSHLDAPSRLATLGHLRRLAADQGKTLLFSSHDLDLAFRGVERLLVLLPEGKWVDGPPAKVAANAACREALGLDAAPWLMPKDLA
jgi:iron complex transport system ATP-binding protein